MKNAKIYRKIISVSLLIVFAFLFSHSELDQFSQCGDSHTEHDYCTLVKTTLTAGIHVPGEQTVQYYFDYPPVLSATECAYINSQKYTLFSPPDNVPLIERNSYLINRSLLI